MNTMRLLHSMGQAFILLLVILVCGAIMVVLFRNAEHLHLAVSLPVFVVSLYAGLTAMLYTNPEPDEIKKPTSCG